MQHHHTPKAGRRELFVLVVALIAAFIAIGYQTQPAYAVGTFSLSDNEYTVTEGNALEIIVERVSGTLDEDTSVVLTFTDGTADAGADFPFANPSLSFIAANQTTERSYFLSTIEDGDEEGSEDLFVAISIFNDDTGNLSGFTSATITIVDDDGPAEYSFATSSSSVTEQDDGSYEVEVIREGETGTGFNDVTCRIQTPGGGTATGGDDDYDFANQGFTFSAGQTSKNCVIELNEDSDTEGDETIILQLFQDVGDGGFADGAGTFTLHTITIIDDDGAGTIGFDDATYTVNENEGTASIAVVRSGGSTGAASVTCRTTGGTATEGDGTSNTHDYLETDDVLSWSTGQSGTRTCTVPIWDNNLVEPQERVDLIIDTPTGAASINASADDADLFITDDDGSGTIQFTSANFTGDEDDASINVSVSRTGDSDGNVSVKVEVIGGTATEGVDYDIVYEAGEQYVLLEWNDGETGTEVFTVDPIDDATPEGTQTVILELFDPLGGASLGAQDTTTVNITDGASTAPIVTLVSPGSGPTVGGTPVTITGDNFTGATSVTFDGDLCTSRVVVSDNTITCVTPANPAGVAEVVVTTPNGSNSTAGTGNDYTYTDGPTVTFITPSTGPATGNTIVTITGTNFTASGMTVTFGGVQAVFNYINATTIVAVAPANTAGVADVRVSTPGGTSPNTTADDFTYTGSSAPTITNVSPNSGTPGTVVIITGTGFTGATSVLFGNVTSSFTVNSSVQITATVPVGTPVGTVDIRVTTAGGSNANTAADNFTNTSSSLVTYTLYFRFTLIVWTGANNTGILGALRGLESPVDNPNTNNVSGIVGAVWLFDPQTQTWKGYFPGSDGVPGANDFTTFLNGQGYFIALLTQGTYPWTTFGGN